MCPKPIFFLRSQWGSIKSSFSDSTFDGCRIEFFLSSNDLEILLGWLVFQHLHAIIPKSFVLQNKHENNEK